VYREEASRAFAVPAFQFVFGQRSEQILIRNLDLALQRAKSPARRLAHRLKPQAGLPAVGNNNLLARARPFEEYCQVFFRLLYSDCLHLSKLVHFTAVFNRTSEKAQAKKLPVPCKVARLAPRRVGVIAYKLAAHAAGLAKGHPAAQFRDMGGEDYVEARK
jgi:hypothetical protein